MIKSVLLILALLGVTLSQGTVSIGDFLGPPFSVKPSSGMYELADLGFAPGVGQQLMAYGDFNNDKFTDVVTMNDANTTLSVYVYNSTTNNFVMITQVQVWAGVISGVLTGDFDFNGLLDIMIVQPGTGSATYGIFLQQQSHTFNQNPDVQTTVSPYQQPLLFDSTGDRLVELLIFNQTTGTRQVMSLQNTDNGWQFTYTEFNSLMSPASGCNPSPQNTPFSVPNSNAFLDLNGDCAADLFLDSNLAGQRYAEIWIRYNGLFCLVDIQPLSFNSQISFADMDNNGAIDAIYTQGNYLTVNILFNQLVGNTDAPCGKAPSTVNSPYPPLWNQGQQQAGLVYTWPVVVSGFSNPTLYSVNPTDRPGKIRIADINIDGRPDILLTLTNTVTNQGAPILVFNLQDGNGGLYLDYNQNSTTSAYYSINVGGSTAPLSTIPVNYITFFDFQEIGNLGFWISQPAKQNGFSSLYGIFNFVSTENFFLKTNGNIECNLSKLSVLNGFYPSNNPDADITNSLGGIYYGPSFECIVTTVAGNTILNKAVQLTQSAYTPLDLSYMYIGLGRTNNYIETFTVGVPTTYQGFVQQTAWTPIIPNSQLIVNPILSQSSPWVLDVYVSPTKETVLIVITTVIILILLGVLILYYHIKEKEEDKKNQDKILHIFG